MIIDVHTHIFPEEIIANPRAYAEKDEYFGFLTKPSPVNHTEQRYATYKEAVEQMDKDGVDMLAIQGWEFMEHELCVWQNNYTLQAMKHYPARIIGFGIVNPNKKEEAVKEARRCLEAGMAGIGEMDPYGQRFELDDPYFLKICDLCREYNAFMNIHVSATIGHNYFGKSDIPLKEFMDLIELKQGVQFILAHYGGGLLFYELLPEIKKLMKNVYYDTAASPLIRSPEAYQRTMDIIGSEKLLFGTDFPLLLYPKVEKEPNFSSMLTEVRNNVNAGKELNDFLGNNAYRLFREKGFARGSGRW